MTPQPITQDVPGAADAAAGRQDYERQLAFRSFVRISRQSNLGDFRRCEAALGLLCTSSALRRRLHRGVGSQRLSESQFVTLVALHAFDPAPCASSDLAVHAQVSRAAMTTILDELVQEGWVERSRPEADRRRIMISLAPNRRAQVRRLIEEEILLMDRLTGVLDSRDCEVLTPILRKLSQYLLSQPAAAE